MSKAVYPLALSAMLDAFITGGAAGGTPTIVMLDSSYGYSSSDQFADALTGQLGDPIALTSLDFTDGVLSADNPSITGTSNGDHVQQVVIYIDTGTPSTSPLLTFDDENGDGTPIDYTSDGNPFAYNFQSGKVCSI